MLLTSGKLYWELVAERTKREARRRRDRADRAVLPAAEEEAAWRRWSATPNATQVAWVQEEPENQGAWPFFGLNLPRKFPELLSGLQVVSRRPMAAPSAGSSKVHEVEQKALISKAFD